jgi:hypothetical protein
MGMKPLLGLSGLVLASLSLTGCWNTDWSCRGGACRSNDSGVRKNADQPPAPAPVTPTSNRNVNGSSTDPAIGIDPNTRSSAPTRNGNSVTPSNAYAPSGAPGGAPNSGNLNDGLRPTSFNPNTDGANRPQGSNIRTTDYTDPRNPTQRQDLSRGVTPAPGSEPQPPTAPSADGPGNAPPPDPVLIAPEGTSQAPNKSATQARYSPITPAAPAPAGVPSMPSEPPPPPPPVPADQPEPQSK